MNDIIYQKVSLFFDNNHSDSISIKSDVACQMLDVWERHGGVPEILLCWNGDLTLESTGRFINSRRSLSVR